MESVGLLMGQRQPGEKGRAMSACNDYLLMGPGRSLSNLLERYRTATEPPPSRRIKTLKDWSRHFGWVERAGTYDDWQVRLKSAEKIKAIEEQAQREITAGQALMASGERVVRELIKRIADGRLEEADWGELKEMWPIARQSLVEGSKLVRLGVGEPTEIQKHILAMGPDELLEFIRRGVAGLGPEEKKE